MLKAQHSSTTIVWISVNLWFANNVSCQSLYLRCPIRQCGLAATHQFKQCTFPQAQLLLETSVLKLLSGDFTRNAIVWSGEVHLDDRRNRRRRRMYIVKPSNRPHLLSQSNELERLQRHALAWRGRGKCKVVGIQVLANLCFPTD